LGDCLPPPINNKGRKKEEGEVEISLERKAETIKTEQYPFRFRAPLSLILVTLFWGTTFSITKLSLATLSPFEYLGLRYGLSATIIFLIFPRKMLSVNRNTLRAGGFLGLLTVCAITLQTVGLVYTQATIGAFITSLAVVFTYVFESLFFSGKATVKLTVAVLLATTGTALLFLEGTIELVIGDLLILGCAVLYAFQTIYTTKYSQHHDIYSLSFLEILAVGVPMLIISSQVGLKPVPTNLTVFIIYLAFVPTVATTFLQFYGQKFLSATQSALIFTLEPIFASIFAFLILSETLSYQGITGAILVLLSIILAVR
jgi:drug/metabolite transporter (DMT)-like permease